MRVKCQYNSGINIPREHRCLGETDNTEYSFLNIGREYNVYALLLFPERVDYLVCPQNEEKRPIWIPSDLCTLINKRLSSLWSICVPYLDDDYKILDSSFNIKTIIGYKELVNSISHYVGVLERDEQHLDVFLNAKNRIDQEEGVIITD